MMLEYFFLVTHCDVCVNISHFGVLPPWVSRGRFFSGFVISSCLSIPAIAEMKAAYSQTALRSEERRVGKECSS